MILGLYGCQDEANLANEGIDTVTRSIEVSEVNPCATISPIYPSWSYSSIQTRNIHELPLREFNVFVHVVRSSSGVGLDKESVTGTIISNLNNYYNGTNISFYRLGNESIDSDFYNNMLFDYTNGLFNTYNNIYHFEQKFINIIES